MTTIPNELKINVTTSVPGYQIFRFEPSMIMKTENKDASIYFNPLIKLKKQIVDKVPEYLRKKQFVNKGLFDSLINFTNATPAKSLMQAKNNGYIDNNISVTLNTLLSQETIITIGGKQYVIVDLEWTPGSWKVDTKKKPPKYDSIEAISSSSSGGNNVNNNDYQFGGVTRPNYINYGRPQYVKNIIRNTDNIDNNKLSYYINIELQLHPGTSISPEERKGLKCNHKWNMVKKSYSELIGKPYVIQPDYTLLSPSTKNTLKNRQSQLNKTQYAKPRQISSNNSNYYQNRYRNANSIRRQNNKYNYGGRTMKRKTKKNYKK
jgi:hypothetical protein